MTAAAMPRAIATEHVRERWRMGPEARGLGLIMVLVLVFGLAVLYSASAIIAEQENHNSWYYVARQLSGAQVGELVVMVGAELDGDKLQECALTVMWRTIESLLLSPVLPTSIA